MRTTDATQPLRDWTILEAPKRWERRLVMRLEGHTTHLPSAVLGAAVIAMGAAVTLHLTGHTQAGLFVGLWSAPYLLIGVCYKLVKAGSSATGTGRRAAERTVVAPPPPSGVNS